MGDTRVVHNSLVSGEIDIYPEYTGTGFREILRLPVGVKDAKAVMESLKQEYRSRWALEWLEPLGFSDSFVMAIGSGDPRAAHISTLTDASRDNQGWRLGMGSGFAGRPDGLRGLLEEYPLRLTALPKVYDQEALYKALAEGEIDMISANATDGLLPKSDVKILSDDRRFFPPYDAYIVARSSTLEKKTELRQALLLISGKISPDAIQEMNFEVDGRHQKIEDVARAFLNAHGLY